MIFNRLVASPPRRPAPNPQWAAKRQAKKHPRTLLDSGSRNDLMLLPSNHFEALGGDRNGPFSLRITRPWRICFEWPDGAAKPFNIEIVDEH